MADHLNLEEAIELTQYLTYCCLGQSAYELRRSPAPVHTPDVIGQHNACHRQAGRDGNLKWITLRLVRHRTNNGQTNFAVVAGRRQHHRRSPPGLLASYLRVESYPNYVASIWNV